VEFILNHEREDINLHELVSGRHFQGICGNQEWEMPCNVFYPDGGRGKIARHSGSGELSRYMGNTGQPSSSAQNENREEASHVEGILRITSLGGVEGVGTSRTRPKKERQSKTSL